MPLGVHLHADARGVLDGCIGLFFDVPTRMIFRIDLFGLPAWRWISTPAWCSSCDGPSNLAPRTRPRRRRLPPDERRGGRARHSPLKPATPSPDSVQMEVIWARCPLNDAEVNDTVWAEIDETQIAPAVHRELARNGFRVGVISGKPPDAIARLLNMDAEPPTTPTTARRVQPLDLVDDTKIHGNRRNLRRGERMEIRASENMAAMTLLVSRGRELGGRTFHDAQAIYALKIDPQPDQTVKVELTPEIHFGPSQLRWSGGEEGMDVVLRQLPMREREVFESMRHGSAARAGRNAGASGPAGLGQPSGPLLPHHRNRRRPRAKARAHPPSPSAAERHVRQPCRPLSIAERGQELIKPSPPTRRQLRSGIIFATASNFELTFRSSRMCDFSPKAKRTRLPSRKNCTLPPRSTKPSDSPTTSTGNSVVARSTAVCSRSETVFGINSIWQAKASRTDVTRRISIACPSTFFRNAILVSASPKGLVP